MAIISAYLLPHPPLIFPEIGRGAEKNITATIEAYQRAGREIRDSQPETIVIVSPHSAAYADYFHISPENHAEGDMSAFRARELVIKTDYDAEFVSALCSLAEKNGFPAGIQGERDTSLDHATMIPLRFIGTGSYKTVRIGISGLSLQKHYEFGKIIAETSGFLNRKTVFIASGDLSHRLKEDGPYGFAEEGPIFDRKITEIIRRGALEEVLSLDKKLCENAGECGLRPLAVMAGAFAGRALKGELYSYEGTFGVGYAVGRFLTEKEKNEKEF